MGNCNGARRAGSSIDNQKKSNGSSTFVDVDSSNNISHVNGNKQKDYESNKHHKDDDNKSGCDTFQIGGGTSFDEYKLSQRSVRSTTSLSSASSPVSSSVHSNLMRTHRLRDPMKYYEVVSILGKGSMGSVAKVKKRESAKGGSARNAFVQENHGVCYQYCNRVFPPLLALIQIIPHKQDVLLVPTMTSSSSSQTSATSFKTIHSTKLTAPYVEDKTDVAKDNDLQDKNMENNLTASVRMKKQVTYASDTSMSELVKPQAADNKEDTNIDTNHSKTIGQVIDTGGFGSCSNISAVTTSGFVSSIPLHSEDVSSSARLNGAHSVANSHKTLKHQYSSIITCGSGKELYYALKSIHLERCSSVEFMEELKNEVEILKQLDYPNIVRAIETFDYKGRLFLLLELCQGGDLYTRDPYSENDAKKIVNCMLSAVSYLHSKGIVHRDLKFENICFSDKSDDAEVRIIDFGLSQKFASNEHLHDAVGTVYTMAPELLIGDYDAKVDIWSVGVIAFSLLSSSLPFYGEDRVTVMKKIIRGKYRFSSKRWASISLDAKTFIRALLNTDPAARPTGFESMENKWINESEGGNIPFTIDEIEQMDRIQTSIQNFTSYPTLKKLALMMVAYKSTSEEVGFLRRMFNKYDTTKDGEITLPEFKKALADHYDYSDEEVENLFHGIDIDGTGKVHYIEFVAATIEAHGAIDEERLAEAFDRIDSDDSGYITVSDLRAFLGQDIPQSYIEKIINEADILHDHRVSYEEFLELWDKDTDEELKNIQTDVKKRRKLYPNIISGDNLSMVSSFASSTDDMTLSDTEANNDDIAAEGSEVPRADFYFSQRKFQSMRKVEIDMKDMEISHDKL